MDHDFGAGSAVDTLVCAAPRNTCVSAGAAEADMDFVCPTGSFSVVVVLGLRGLCVIQGKATWYARVVIYTSAYPFCYN